jgi:hypothetical protein
MFPHGAADRKSQRQAVAVATDLTREMTLGPPRFMIDQPSPSWRRRVRAQAVAATLIRLPTCGLEFL